MPTIDASRRRPRKTVLAVDDDRLILTVVRSVLEDDGHRVLTAASGFRAIDMCLAQTIDLLVLDVLMPGLTGIEVSDELRKYAHTFAIPILFCTGSRALLPPLVMHRRRVDVISKPFDAASLQGAVRQLLA